VVWCLIQAMTAASARCSTGIRFVLATVPLPTGVAWWGPSVAIAWLVIGIIGALARPAATRRAGELLTAAEGLGGSAPVAAGQLAREGEVTS